MKALRPAMILRITSVSERAASACRAPWIGWLLALGQIALVITLAWQWLCVSTHRLYLDAQRGSQGVAQARQRFELSGGRVEPQILSTAQERITFALDFSQPSELRVRAVPDGQVRLEIALVRQGARQVLLRRAVHEATDIVQALPPLAGLLELANEGPLVWSDPRVVPQNTSLPALLGLLALVVLARLRGLAAPPLALPHSAWARTALLGALTASLATGLGLGLLELGLRAGTGHLPAWIVAARRNLGEVHTDPRWQEGTRYGTRLAARIDTFCEWQHGDIVRLGFVPPGLARHAAYRFPFVTDADGFRNATATPTRALVAALGDSFTDGMTLPAELTWPAQLAHLLGVSVRNYGTAGFGPGQELLVLEEYVRARHPRWVVVAFFAGNDLLDAERFEHFQRDGRVSPSPALGWQFKNIVARFDSSYLASLYEGVSALRVERARGARRVPRSAEDYSGSAPDAATSASPAFDRGLFTVQAGGRAMQFAFLPPYLNSLKLGRPQIEASRGWALTRASYRAMQRVLRAQGGELIVLFIPSKAQVYLPVLEQTFPRDALRRALHLSLIDQPQPPTLETMMRNRLALNDLMREFCAREGMLFLDTTAALQSQASAGHNVYFPDDSHWNAAGHATAAGALASLVSARRDASP